MPSNVAIERLPKSRVTATLVFTPEEKQRAENQALQNMGSRTEIKGFRVGHAPADAIRARFSEEQILEETVRVLMQGQLTQIVTENQISPVIPPKIELQSRDPLTVKITFVERPEVKMKNLDSLKIEKKSTKADPKDVQRVIDSALNDHRTRTAVDRAAKENDMVTINFFATDDQNKEIQGMRAEGYEALIGSKTLLPGFEDQLVGLKKGDQKSFTLTLPDKFQVEELRNKPATFHVTVTNVEETHLPEFNDAFAKEKLNAPSAAEFKALVEKSIEGQEEQFDRMRRERELMEEIKKRTDVEIADELLDEEMRSLVQEWSDRLEQQGSTIEEALKRENRTVQQAEEDLKKQAEERWKLRLGMAKIIEEKAVSVSDEEVNHAFEHFLERVPEEQRPAATQEFQSHGTLYDELRWQALVEKVMEMLLA
ncbi:MAG TPA: trigger factor [Candidatus Peribacteraceae bacterium]|nr:trigger factor [Candidatus Peribacteraceae bacterium]